MGRVTIGTMRASVRAVVLHVEHLGRLHLESPPQPGRPAHLAAASGLVHDSGRLFVVADDEPLLAIFEDADAKGRVERLVEEDMPLDRGERKAAKPDLEALAELPGGELLALGSGATERRERGWIWRTGHAVQVSLSSLYRELRRDVAELNIEGAAVISDRLWLAQRGNGVEGDNMLVELDLRAGLEPEAILSKTVYHLGAVQGVGLTFSDLAPLPDGRLLFCAVAEDSGSTYEDGPCVGAGLGLLDPARREVVAFELLAEPHKVEGAAPAPDGGVFLVADADDPDKPAPLLRTGMPAGAR